MLSMQVTESLARIQGERDGQEAPDGPDIDLLAAVHQAVISLREQGDASGVDSEVNQPLVLQEEAQHWNARQENTQVQHYQEYPTESRTELLTSKY